MAETPMRKAYGEALAAYGAVNPDVIVLDVDTSSSTLSGYFRDLFPQRFFNIGIAEPCMIDVGVGFALEGYIPFVNGFSALLALRAIEAIRTNVGYARTNVKIAANYAGLSDYKDGPTHHTIFDIAIFRAMPEMTLLVPADGVEAAAFVPLMAEFDGPVTMRINRDATLPVHTPGSDLKIGKGIVRRPGNDLAIIACGSMVGRSLKAAEELSTMGIDTRVVEIHTLKPLDKGLILQTVEEVGAVLTAEEHTVIGGLGGAVAEVIAGKGPVRFGMIGIKDVFARTGPDTESLMDAFGLSVAEIVQSSKTLLEE